MNASRRNTRRNNMGMGNMNMMGGFFENLMPASNMPANAAMMGGRRRKSRRASRKSRRASRKSRKASRKSRRSSRRNNMMMGGRRHRKGSKKSRKGRKGSRRH
jgi:hypothetical protein